MKPTLTDDLKIRPNPLKSLTQKGRTWRNLSPQERSLLMPALALLPLVTLVLKLGGLKRTQAILTSLSPSAISPPSDAQIAQIITTVRMVKIAVRYNAPWTTCLKKSLVLWYLLRRQGIAANLQIGVRLEQGQFQAHAWVEYQGLVVGDRADVRQQYTAFDNLNTQLNERIFL